MHSRMQSRAHVLPTQVEFGEVYNRHANFQNFGSALITLFRCSTGEDWQDIMYDIIDRPFAGSGLPQWLWSIQAHLYFIVFEFFSAFIVLNLFVMIITENFDYSNAERCVALRRLSAVMSRAQRVLLLSHRTFICGARFCCSLFASDYACALSLPRPYLSLAPLPHPLSHPPASRPLRSLMSEQPLANVGDRSLQISRAVGEI